MGVGVGFRMIQAHYTYCALYYYYISSISDHQELEPGDWGALTLENIFFLILKKVEG